MFLHACFLVAFPDDFPRLHNQAFGVRRVAKPTFPIYWDSVDFVIEFKCFLIASGPILKSCGGLETGSKFHDL